jgi:low affinity Fe/Cu permease
MIMRWYTTAMNTEINKLASHHPHVKIVRHIVPADTEQLPKQSKDSFHRISMLVSSKLGSPIAFLLAVLLIVLWVITGPFFDFSDTWQLVINTTTTILMVFAIQNTQNRDARAMQIKLNELIKGSSGARTEYVDIEDLTDSELDVMQAQFKELHDQILAKKQNRR